jgi:hypothetical protein
MVLLFRYKSIKMLQKHFKHKKPNSLKLGFIIISIRLAGPNGRFSEFVEIY